MKQQNEFSIRPFQPQDQNEVRHLILEGLKQRFGNLNPDFNLDVNDIGRSYIEQGASFIVAEADGKIVGCGALIHENGSQEIGRIVRVSVAVEYQGRGLGRKLSQRLLHLARERGFKQILVETNHNWESALRLYQSLGFQEFKRETTPFGYQEIHMALFLS